MVCQTERCLCMYVKAYLPKVIFSFSQLCIPQGNHIFLKANQMEYIVNALNF